MPRPALLILAAVAVLLAVIFGLRYAKKRGVPLN
jgi:hypothetical protein